MKWILAVDFGIALLIIIVVVRIYRLFGATPLAIAIIVAKGVAIATFTFLLLRGGAGTRTRRK